LWVLISGQAQMTMLTPDGDETVLDVMLPGELFGLPGLFASTADRVGESVATEARFPKRSRRLASIRASRLITTTARS
jgi:CRP-like cAMP-binding protein